VAYLFKQPKSPYWWVSYKDAAGDRQRESLKLRHDNLKQTKAAKTKCLFYTAKESESLAYEAHEEWNAWVPGYIKRRYLNKNTLESSNRMWLRIKEYLTAHNKDVPKVITTQTISGMISSLRKTGIVDNYVKNHISLFSVLMKEAMRRGFSDHNPCLGWEFSPAKVKANKLAIPDADISKCLILLRELPFWMTVSFKLGLYHGVRLRESLPKPDQIDLRKNVVTFYMKGGVVNTVPIHPEVRRELEVVAHSGLPEVKESGMSQWFQRFFKKHNLPYSHHCLRVTCITKMAQAGVPIQHAMSYVHHATQAIHLIYIRLQAKDLGHVHASVAYDL